MQVFYALCIFASLGASLNIPNPPENYVLNGTYGLYVSWNTSYFTGDSLAISILTAAQASVSFTTTINSASILANGYHTLNVGPFNLLRERSYVFLVDSEANNDVSAQFDITHYLIPININGELGQKSELIQGSFYDFGTTNATQLDYYFDDIFLGTTQTQLSGDIHFVDLSIPVPQVEPGLHSIHYVIPEFASLVNLTYPVTVLDVQSNADLACQFSTRGTCGPIYASTCSSTPFGFCNASANPYPMVNCAAFPDTDCACEWPWRELVGTACMNDVPLANQTALGQVCTDRGECIPGCPSTLEECQVFCKSNESITFTDHQCVCTETDLQCICALGEFTCPSSRQCFETTKTVDAMNCSDIEDNCLEEDIINSTLCISQSSILFPSFSVHSFLVILSLFFFF